jgi:hypothetical protein
MLERLAVVETKIESLMTYHKWTLGLLTSIFLIAIRVWLR